MDQRVFRARRGRRRRRLVGVGGGERGCGDECGGRRWKQRERGAEGTEVREVVVGVVGLCVELRAQAGELLLHVDEHVGAGRTVARRDPAERVEEYETVEHDGLLDGRPGRLVGGVRRQQAGEREHQRVGRGRHRALRRVVRDGHEHRYHAARQRRDEQVRKGDFRRGLGRLIGHRDASVDTASPAAAVLDRRHHTVGLRMHEAAPCGEIHGGGLRRRGGLVDDHDGEQAEAV